MFGIHLKGFPDISAGRRIDQNPVIAHGPAFGGIQEENVKQILFDGRILFAPEFSAVGRIVNFTSGTNCPTGRRRLGRRQAELSRHRGATRY